MKRRGGFAKPILVALDFKRRRARSYIPKQLHPGFLHPEEARIGRKGEKMAAFGDEEGMAIIENFRLGKLRVEQRKSRSKSTPEAA